MEGIYEPNSQFPFDKMVITSPTALSGGNYFLRFLVNQAPLYLQMPKSKTKAGVVQSGKKSICDLQFTNENEDLISWMEDLEGGGARDARPRRPSPSSSPTQRS